MKLPSFVERLIYLVLPVFSKKKIKMTRSSLIKDLRGPAVLV